MEVLDEKANGAPHLEPEEMVSVRDREYNPTNPRSTASFMFSLCIRRGVRSQAHARSRSRSKGVQSLHLEACELEEVGKEDY